MQNIGCNEQNDQVIFENGQEPSIEHYLKKPAVTEGLVAYYPFNGNADDKSTNDNHGIVYGAVLTEDRFGNPSSAYRFDDYDGYIEIAHRTYLNINSPGITVAVWIKAKPEQYSRDDHYSILDKSHGYGCLGYATGWTIQGRTDIPFPSPSFGFVYGDGANYDNGAGISHWELGAQWRFLTGICDFVTVKFYMDGIFRNSRDLTGFPAPNEGVLSIGRWWCGDVRGWPAKFFNGIIDDIRIYHRPLSEDEIISLYEEGTAIGVLIDIKPGSYPNCFNNNGQGVIPVAVLGRSDFDVNQIDPATVTLEGMEIKAVGKSNKLLAHIEDVNYDGIDDLIVQIEDTDGVFTEGSTIATLTGSLKAEFGGTPIEGTDEICIVP